MVHHERAILDLWSRTFLRRPSPSLKPLHPPPPPRPHNHAPRRHITTPTRDQLQTASLQTTPHTPNQIVTEVPHTPIPPAIDIPSPLWYHRLPISSFFSWFSRLQRRRPLTVTVYTSLTTYLLGDLLAQELGGEPYSPARTLRMLFIGGLASIPGYKWFLFLGSRFNHPTSKTLSIAAKVAVQQIFFAPLFSTYFFAMQAALAGDPPSVIAHRVATAVPRSVLSSAYFWPVVTAVNFAVVPAHFRFMFSGVFAVVWQGYLSFLNRRVEEEGPMGTLAEQGRVEIFEASVAAGEEVGKKIEAVALVVGGGGGERVEGAKGGDERGAVGVVREKGRDRTGVAKTM